MLKTCHWYPAQKCYSANKCCPSHPDCYVTHCITILYCCTQANIKENILISCNTSLSSVMSMNKWVCYANEREQLPCSILSGSLIPYRHHGSPPVVNHANTIVTFVAFGAFHPVSWAFCSSQEMPENAIYSLTKYLRFGL